MFIEWLVVIFDHGIDRVVGQPVVDRQNRKDIVFRIQAVDSGRSADPDRAVARDGDAPDVVTDQAVPAREVLERLAVVPGDRADRRRRRVILYTLNSYLYVWLTVVSTRFSDACARDCHINETRA